jgi:histidyl-tRNA synthetase
MDSPVMLDYLCGPCKSHFETVEQGLRKLGIPFEVNKRLVRGLDYYTRTTFELVMGHMGAQNTVAAGGRYDGLVKEIGGPATPGIGFALGVERAISLMDTKNVVMPRPTLFIAALGPDAVALVLPLIHHLKSSGLPVETDYTGASLKSQMKKADKSGAGHTLIIGEQEMKNGLAILRNMQNKEQSEIALVNMEEELKKRLARPT